MGLGEVAVEFGAAVGEAVNLVFAGTADKMFVTRGGRIDFGVKDLFAVVVGEGEGATDGIGDLALADEGESAFLANAIHGDEVDVVLEGAGVDDMLGDEFRSGRPVGGKADDVGPGESEGAGRFGEGGVVTDEQADIQVARGMNGIRAVAVGGVHVDAEERQVCLAIGADQSRGADEERSVEEARGAVGAVRAFEHAEDTERIGLAADGLHRGDGGTGHGLGKGERFGGAGEAIAGDGTLGEDDEFGAVAGGFAVAIGDARQVAGDVADLDVHLNAGNLHGR